MHRRVKMRAVVFEHPEATREITVSFKAGVYLGFEATGVTRPRDQLIVNRVSEVEDARVTGDDALEHGVREAGFRAKRQCPPCGAVPDTLAGRSERPAGARFSAA